MEEINKSENFTISLVDTLSEPWEDLGVDIAEESIDSCLDNEFLKAIPVVKTGIALCKAGIQIRDKFLLKKTLNFIAHLNDKTLTELQIEQYRKRLRSDRKWAEKELEHVTILLDSSVNLNQSTRLAKFYQAYISGRIDWDKFCELSEANSKIFEADVKLLAEIATKEGERTDYRASRLFSVGLLIEKSPSITGGTLNINNFYYMSEFGKLFLDCLAV